MLNDNEINDKSIIKARISIMREIHDINDISALIFEYIKKYKINEQNSEIYLHEICDNIENEKQKHKIMLRDLNTLETLIIKKCEHNNIVTISNK